MKTRKGAWQRLVNRVASAAINRGERSLDEIRAAVRREARMEALRDDSILFGDRTGLEDQPTDHDLQIMVSRLCMGEGEWDFYPSYTTPPRYLSRARVERLVHKAEFNQLTPDEREELKGLHADLANGVRHWRAKHARARAKEEEMQALARRIEHHAFKGHAGELL